MYKSYLFRIAIVATVCILFLLFVSQFFTSTSDASASQAQGTVSNHLGTVEADGHMDWAVIAVLLFGAVIFLFRPRRSVATSSNEQKS